MIAPRQPHAVSLRISVTDRCPLHCLYCRPPAGVRAAPRRAVLRFDEIVEFVGLVRSRWHVSKVHLTGGEPLVRRGVVELVARLAGLDIADLALTTNGQRLAGMAADLRGAGLRRVNVSLDSLDPGTYRGLSRGLHLERTLAGIDAARRSGLAPVKLNMVVLRGINDHEVGRIARFGLQRGCEVRFLEVMPIGAAAARHGEWFVPSEEVRERLAAVFRLEPLPAEDSASSRTFRAADGAGRAGLIGFISPCSRPFCSGCRRLRLTATGRLLGCLAQADGIDVRPFLRRRRPRDRQPLLAAVREALRVKRRERRFADQQPMICIGG